MIEVKDISIRPDKGLKVVCEVSQSEGETILSQELTLMIDGSRYLNPKVKASMTITDLEANSSEEALAKMSEWCRRMSEALAKASKSKMISLPI